jgi:dipeptidyl aminopeptidase/acylaminoacyl peptidase
LRRTGGRNSSSFGAWASPLTPDMLASAGVKPGFLQADGDDLYWQEGRPADGGRTTLVRRGADGTIEDVAPNVRTRVHEYGGRAFAARGGRAVWATDGDEPRLADHELGDGVVICVREIGEVNEIVAVPLDGGEPTVLHTGRDFYAAPRLGPGGQLAYLAWDHPDMPWDAAELWVDDRRVAGGEGVSALQPTWAADGSLLWIDDRTGWWNLYRDDQPVAPMDAEIGYPLWQFGFQSFCEAADGTLWAAVRSNGSDRLVTIRAGVVEIVDQPFTELMWLVPFGDGIACVAGAPDRAMSVVAIAPGTVEVLRSGSDLDLDPAFISRPEHVSFPGAYALFYPPANPGFAGPEDERPPVIVLSHGGPTASAMTVLDLDIQFWTTRGFAVADVNYRGSTGYGTEFREALRGLWGIADVEDCVACVKQLADEGRVDGDRAVIRGWSAGGYTTLQALTTTDAFAAGSSHYGVADAAALARDTHKFEARYLDRLIGPWPEAEPVYAARSALNHLDGFSAPVILFQGLEDRVVPPDQARSMAAALAEQGIEHELHLFEGEDHGFRRADTKRRVIEAELEFLKRVLAVGSPAS